jgi:uncharacterized protein (DUF934 family)
MTTRLWTGSGFRPDPWRHGGEAAQGIILPLAAWLALDDSTRRGFALGVRVAPSEPIVPLLPHLHAIPLIALEFPAFSDGRSYSRAEQLRGRHRFGGRLRAVGDVLLDQIPHMLRTGFDEIEVSNAATIARLGQEVRPARPGHYQPAAASGARALGYAWRRAANG